MGSIRDAFDDAVKANAQVVAGVDAAVVATGRALADEIDWAVDNLVGQERTKALYLVPHLMNVLKEMLATPASRVAVGIVAKEASSGRVGKFRSVAGGKAS